MLARLSGSALAALVVLVTASGPRADEVCTVARVLLAAEASSTAILLAPDDAAAAGAVRELEERLDRAGAYAARMARPHAGDADLAGPVFRFIESRRQLVATYRARGLAAAREQVLDVDFIKGREDMRALLRRRPGCSPPDDRIAPAGAMGGGAMGSVGDDLSWPAPTGPARPVRAAASVWRGLGVLAALCLLLVAFLVFDAAERCEDRRFACHVPGRLRIRGATWRVVIVEISRGGAKLRTAGAYPVGARGVLLVLGTPKVFKIEWATPTFCGVSFRRKLDVPVEQLSRLSAPGPHPAGRSFPMAAK